MIIIHPFGFNLGWLTRLVLAISMVVLKKCRVLPSSNFLCILWRVVVCDARNPWKSMTMPPTAQQKRLGVGASCTVSMRFLHPKNKVKKVIHNQTASQKLSGLIVQGNKEKTIRKAGKECVVFRHEDFGGQLIWALTAWATRI